MCGIAGFLGHKNIDHRQIIQTMINAIQYRGPDDHGVYLEIDGEEKYSLSAPNGEYNVSVGGVPVTHCV